MEYIPKLDNKEYPFCREKYETMVFSSKYFLIHSLCISYIKQIIKIVFWSAKSFLYSSESSKVIILQLAKWSNLVIASYVHKTGNIKIFKCFITKKQKRNFL